SSWIRIPRPSTKRRATRRARCSARWKSPRRGCELRLRTSDVRLSMILVIDNYDSFTYNLVQYLGELGADVHVVRNDAVTVDEVAAANPQRIVILAGPGRPEDPGVTMSVIKRFGESTPILGVCLGHQAIGAAF